LRHGNGIALVSPATAVFTADRVVFRNGAKKTQTARPEGKKGKSATRMKREDILR